MPPAREKQRQLFLVTLLTFLRFPLVMLFFAGALVNAAQPRTWLFVASLGALIASAITDLFDGLLARRFEVQTEFGAQVDPLMDKFFYLATFPLLVYVATVNGHRAHAVFLLVLTVLFLTRDQWVTFLRSIGALYRVSGGAHWAGKVRTALNFPLICAIYYFEEAPPPFQLDFWGLLLAFEIIGLLLNIISVYTYTRFYSPYLRKSAALHDTPGSAR